MKQHTSGNHCTFALSSNFHAPLASIKIPAHLALSIRVFATSYTRERFCAQQNKLIYTTWLLRLWQEETRVIVLSPKTKVCF